MSHRVDIQPVVLFVGRYTLTFSLSDVTIACGDRHEVVLVRSVFVASVDDSPVGRLELVSDYLGWHGHGLRVFRDVGDCSEEEVINLIRNAEVFLLVGSSPRTTRGRDQEEWIIRQLDQAVAADCKIVFAEVSDPHSWSHSRTLVPDSSPANARLLPPGHTRDPDVTIYSGTPSESTLRSLLSVVSSVPLHLDRSLSEFAVTRTEWRRLLDGVWAAAGLDRPQRFDADPAAWMDKGGEHSSLDGRTLLGMSEELPDVTCRSLARRAVVIGLLRKIGRDRDIAAAAPTDVRPLWPMLQSTLDVSSGIPLQVTLSSQGFYLIPLFSIVRHGRIEELLRLHIWPGTTVLPTGRSIEGRVQHSGQAMQPFSVHSHQPYATSWVLSGGLRNHVYDVREWPAGSVGSESYSLFEVAWDGAGGYSIGHRQSSLRNTQVPVSVMIDNTALFRAGDCYVVPAGEFHETGVLENVSVPTATLFHFDATVGWLAKARVVGPASVDRSAPHEKTAVDGVPLIESVTAAVEVS